jgi:hypothetical protein
MENSNIKNEPFYYDEKVDVVNEKAGTVLEASIVSIRGNIYVVRYTNTQEEDNININEGRIIKQCNY